jgi:hypothetical protein
MPPSAAPTLTRRALAALALVGALGIGGAGAAWAQDPTATTVPVTPTSGVLVQGGPTTPTTTPSSTSTSQAPADDDADDDGGLLDLDANEKVWVIVGALVAIALLMMVLTVLYWRHTKPDKVKQDRRITRAEKKADKRERKAEKRERKAAGKDPFVEDVEIDDFSDLRDDDEFEADDGPPAHPTGPLDLDSILGAPDPSRSVFGATSEDDEPDR